jgi:hypothetical protein
VVLNVRVHGHDYADDHVMHEHIAWFTLVANSNDDVAQEFRSDPGRVLLRLGCIRVEEANVFRRYMEFP